jgi:hypothetical protein
LITFAARVCGKEEIMACVRCKKSKLPHNLYPIGDWKYAVANGDTILGYVDWTKHCEERDYEPTDAEMLAEKETLRSTHLRLLGDSKCR